MAKAETQEVERERPVERKIRIPIDGRQMRLSVDFDIPGYRPYWANDEGMRITMMQQAGYEFVEKSEVGLVNDPRETAVDNRVRRWVGKNTVGQPLYAYLMKIPLGFHEEDMRNMEARIAEVENQMKALQKVPNGNDGGIYGKYKQGSTTAKVV